MQERESEFEVSGQSEMAAIQIETLHYVCPRCRRELVRESLDTAIPFAISFHVGDDCLGAFCLYCLVETIRALVPELISWTPRDNAAPEAPAGAV